MNRAEALAEALRASGFACEVDHDHVHLVAPEHTTATVVGADVDGYLCSFVALPTHSDKDARAWANWTATVRDLVAEAWPDVAPLEVPPAKPPEPARASEPAEPRYDHAWPLFAPVDDGLAHAYQTAREGRFVVVREWQTWDGPEGPRVTWHAWARDVAADLGVAAGWATLQDQPTIAASHPAAEHVRRVLCEAAQRVEAPGGVVALDLRGLTLATAEAVVRGLAVAARSRCCNGWTRGGVVLCDAQTAMYINRCVGLDASANVAL